MQALDAVLASQLTARRNKVRQWPDVCASRPFFGVSVAVAIVVVAAALGAA
jgi:hypothetical protein